MKLDTHVHRAGRRRLPDRLAAVGVPATHGAARRALADARTTADLLHHHPTHASHELGTPATGPERSTS